MLMLSETAIKQQYGTKLFKDQGFL